MRPLATASWWMFVVGSGWLLLFGGGHSTAQNILKTEGKFWHEGGL